jgi:glycosyltransferase involved in cell wall biosynthesis
MVHKVSVILPCYNGTRWLSRAIESVLSQMYENFELVIVDDGSTDSSSAIITPYLSDNRVRYVYHNHGGFSAALNKGIAESNGDLIGFIGQDDLWTPNKLLFQIEYIKKHPGIDLVHSDYYVINSEERILRVVRGNSFKNYSKEQIIMHLFLNNSIGFETVLINRNCFNKIGVFDEGMAGFSDHEMWLRVAGFFKIGYVDKPLVKKRQHDRQLSKVKIESMLDDEFRMVKRMIACYPFLRKLEHRKLASLFYERGIVLLKKGKTPEAKRELHKAIKWMPWNLKAIAIYIAPTFYRFISNKYEEISYVPSALGWLER